MRSPRYEGSGKSRSLIVRSRRRPDPKLFEHLSSSTFADPVDTCRLPQILSVDHPKGRMLDCRKTGPRSGPSSARGLMSPARRWTGRHPRLRWQVLSRHHYRNLSWGDRTAKACSRALTREHADRPGHFLPPPPPFPPSPRAALLYALGPQPVCAVLPPGFRSPED